MAGRYWPAAIVVVALQAASAAGAQDADASAQRAYARAMELEARGNYQGALSLLWEASGLTPRNADIQNRLGEALERIGALDAAVDAYRRAVAERPDFRKASSNLILALVKVGKGPEAIARARALVAAAPSDADRYFTLGLAQSEQDFEAAIATFRKTLELAPQHTLARYNLALVLRRADRLTEALEELTRSLAAGAQPETHYTMGVIYWHQGELDRATRALRAAIDLQPKYADAHYALGGVLKAKGDLSPAIASMRRAATLQPERPEIHYSLGQVLQLNGEMAAGRKEMEESERLRRAAAAQHEALVITSVAIERMNASDFEGALAHLRRATLADGSYAPAHYQMGLAFQRLGRLTEARAAFDKAQSLNPSLVPPRIP